MSLRPLVTLRIWIHVDACAYVNVIKSNVDVQRWARRFSVAFSLQELIARLPKASIASSAVARRGRTALL